MPYATKNANENLHICGYCHQSFCTNWGLCLNQRTSQIRKNTCKDPKHAQEILNVEFHA